jgi:hypothetical protein
MTGEIVERGVLLRNCKVNNSRRSIDLTGRCAHDGREGNR